MARPGAAELRKQLGSELIECAFSGQHREIARLVEEGADLEVVDRAGYSAISEAAMAGHTVVVGQLLRAAADPNHAALDGRTALHRAAFHGWVPVLRLLLENGADPSFADSDGRTALELVRSRDARDLLTSFPAEESRAAIETRKQLLAALPVHPPDDVIEQEPIASEDDNAVSTAKQETGFAFSPPPRDEKQQVPKEEPAPDGSTDKEQKATSKAAKRAERDAKYKQAMAELQLEIGEEEGSPAAPPSGAKVEVRCAGEDRLNGIYRACFIASDRVEFEKEDDEVCQLTWSDWTREWRIFIGDFKMGSTLYRHSYRPNLKVEDCHGVPQEGWQKWFGKEPAPLVRRMSAEEGLHSRAASDKADEQELHPAAGTSGADEGAATQGPVSQADGGPSRSAEFIELHPRLEIVAPQDDRAVGLATKAAAGQHTAGAFDVSLGGQRVVETADGLFGAGEVAEGAVNKTQPLVEDAGEAAEQRALEGARRWLESTRGTAEEVPATWESIHAAKAAAQELHAEKRVADALGATTAAIGAARRLLAQGGVVPQSSETVDTGSPPSIEQVEALLGVLHSNRSLLLLQLLDAGNAAVLAFGAEAAFRLVADDADLALRADASNFKASFRRARALFELGDFDQALADSTRVVDHYGRSASKPNPEAVALREQILEAVKMERKKWTERGPPKWNKATVGHEPMISEVSGGATGPVETVVRPATSTAPWDAIGVNAAPSTAGVAAARTPTATARLPAAPRTACDVEKALLSTLRGNSERQTQYFREHLTAPVLRRLYRRTAPGPDLLAVMIRLLANFAAEDVPRAAEVLASLAVAPSLKMQVAMFDDQERAALTRLLACVGTEAAAAWELRPESGGA